ncbi:hypothetical protein ONZ51_g7680 [Trametes cubensis]|uniref:DUF6535 domain-containing protein n=1 Tax=Trametes cubensis TaxID=1111947 RepID=A0AAD7TS76_9APHY|nr:hypothetical protein ONZ51_g7680 [Trametes cubensis]
MPESAGMSYGFSQTTSPTPLTNSPLHDQQPDGTTEDQGSTPALPYSNQRRNDQASINARIHPPHMSHYHTRNTHQVTDSNVKPGTSVKHGPSIASSGPNSAWASCVKALRDHDQQLVQGWKEDVDSLLVFAGLFSAVVTAFNIESYKFLQEDPDEKAAALLGLILAQLTANSTQIPQMVSPPTSRIDARSIRINVLWFSSLVLSLFSASVGILTKQWLREYTLSASSSPRQNARVRQLRQGGFEKWKIPLTIALLPVFLQIALALFFIGLLDLLWSLDAAVAWVITIIVAISLAFLVFTTLMPTFHADCPYKSAQALGIYFVMQSLFRVLAYFALQVYSWLGWDRPGKWPLHLHTSFFRPTPRRVALFLRNIIHRKYHYTWREREAAIVNSCAAQLDQRFLADADLTLMEDEFLYRTISACLNDTQCSVAVASLDSIIRNRADLVQDDIPKWMRRDPVDGSVNVLLHLVLDVLPRIDRADHEAISRMLTITSSMCRAIPLEAETYDAAHLYRRLFNVLAMLLTYDSAVGMQAFRTMQPVWDRSDAAVEPSVIQRLISFALDAKRANDFPTLHAGCEMILAFAITSTDAVIESVRNDLQRMLRELDQYLTSSGGTISTPGTPALGLGQSTSILVALVELDARDSTLITTAESPKLREFVDRVKARTLPPTGDEVEDVPATMRRRLEYVRQLREYRERAPHASIGRRRTTMARTMTTIPVITSSPGTMTNGLALETLEAPPTTDTDSGPTACTSSGLTGSNSNSEPGVQHISGANSSIWKDEETVLGTTEPVLDPLPGLALDTCSTRSTPS